MSSLVVGKSWLTLEELSQYLCFSKEKIYLLLKARQIPAVKVGRHWRFNRQHIDEWLISLTPSVEQKPDNTEKQPYSASLEIGKPAGEIKVVLQKEILDPKLQNDLWETYHDTFERNKEKAAQDQRSYDQSTFIDALTDSDYLKFVLVKDDSIKGLSLATNNLDKARIVYMNPEYFKTRYPNFAQAGKIFYVTALSVISGFHELKGINELLTTMIHFIDQNEAVVAFDYSENKNHFLPDLIQLLARRNNIPVIGNKLDAQVYFEIYGEKNRQPG